MRACYIRFYLAGTVSPILYGRSISSKLLFEWLILYLLNYLDVKGFASGDPENDAYAIRKFVQDGHQIMLSQSFAKVGAFPKRFVIISE